MQLVSAPLAEVARSADTILVGRLEAEESSLHSYEYGASSRSWTEVEIRFRVQERLKGDWAGDPAKASYHLDHDRPLRTGPDGEEIQDITGSGLETSLRKGSTYVFFLNTYGGARTLLRVEPATAQTRKAVRKALAP